MIDPIDIDAITDPAELRALCRLLDEDAQSWHDALQHVLLNLVSSGFVRAKPRQPVLAPKAQPASIDLVKAT